MKSTLILRGETPLVEITRDALELKSTLIKEAESVTSITSSFQQEIAADTLGQINDLIRGVEDARKEVKAPVLDLGRGIDSAAKSFSAELLCESKRIGSLVASYIQAERVKAEQARRRAEEEERKIIAEQQIREQKAMEEAKVDGKFIDRVEVIERDTAERIRDVRQNQVVASAPTPEGVSIRETWRYEVVDLAELASKRPELVVIEPNRGAINAMVKAGARSIPGVKIFAETTTITK